MKPDGSIIRIRVGICFFVCLFVCLLFCLGGIGLGFELRASHWGGDLGCSKISLG
jgi:hypothetical protein